MPSYPIEIHGIFIAPSHRVFGHKPPQDLGGGDLQSLTNARLIADSGIEGDRFCRHRPDYNGHVTFFSLEVWIEIKKCLSLPDTVGPEIARRNIIVSGVDLKALYDQPFEIQGIQFAGTVHCAPCLAMNEAIGKDARTALYARGGLRAQVRSSGELKTGKSELTAEVEFDPIQAAFQEPKPDLP
ncbi:MAG: molybdenum cofactor biosysynthesis protein [Symploca sp. SIO2D2]|nr:molybdenum cofactor biosysynthesis protein [Symploca sp. SIO2D2]